MTRQEELNEAWCKYRGKCSTEIIQALAFALKWADAHPHWTSVEDELPRCYIPYNNYDGTPSDVLESEKVIVLLFDGTICIATFNQNLDVDTDKPTGSPYWFDEGHPEDGDRIRGEVTHWMPLPAPVLSNVEKTGKNQKGRKEAAIKASECKCCEGGKQAVAFYPVIDPDIPSYPYCRECLDKARLELAMKIWGNDSEMLTIAKEIINENKEKEH